MKKIEQELKLCCLRPVYKKDKPIHTWLFGAPGTGKTLVAKHTLKQIDVQKISTGHFLDTFGAF